LLDGYSSERHPLAAQVLDWSRAQVALMRPSRHSRALKAIIRDLIDTRDGATYFAERVWGISLRYDLGRSHPVVGRSAPDFELVNGTKLGDLLNKGRGKANKRHESRAPAAEIEIRQTRLGIGRATGQACAYAPQRLACAGLKEEDLVV
jgi:hypothetical protein